MLPPPRLIVAAAKILCLRGWLDPDDVSEWPASLGAELASLAEQGRRRTGPARLTPDALASRWQARKEAEHERSLPAWSCDCGAVFKRLSPWDCLVQFYRARKDGLLGDLAGEISTNQKGKVTHSGTCPACGRRYADTIARQADPQQTLF